MAATRFTVDSAASDSRPTDPVIHHAPVLRTMVASAAAIDSHANRWSFERSATGAGPGVGVRSSWPRPTLYRSISGTSMATPHVAGIAALYAEANSDVLGGALGWLLLQNAMRLSLPVNDIGAGLVQAP